MVASSFFKYTISETQTLIKLCLSKCTTSLNSPYCPPTLNGWSGNCWASQAIFWAPVENSGRRAQHRAAQMASVRNKCKIGGNINHNCKWEVLVIAPRVRTRLNITLDIRLTAFKFRYLYKSRLKLLFSIYSISTLWNSNVGHGWPLAALLTVWPGCSSGYLNPHLMCHRAALCELGQP